jgi:hypothetical protein
VRCSARRTRRDWILRSSYTEGVPRDIREESPVGAGSTAFRWAHASQDNAGDDISSTTPRIRVCRAECGARAARDLQGGEVGGRLSVGR